MTVKLYTTPTCPWCKKTKDWLKKNKIKYLEKNVVEDVKARDEMIKKSGQMGVPVIEVDGKLIIGFDPEGIKAALKTTAKRK